jgi:hypothetical protein
VDTAFAQALEPWHDFYAAVSAAAATLVGLLFVSLSVNLKLFTGDEHADSRAIAIETFANFVYVLSIALVLLIPDVSPSGVGITFGIFGVMGTLTTVRRLSSASRRWRRRHARRLTYWRFISARFILPLVSYLSLLVIATMLWSGNTEALSWLLFVIFTLLISAAQNAWDLLIGLASNDASGQDEWDGG